MSSDKSAYLLVISIGPVQDFISAARRTRDLWFGSFALSEISKAVAAAVQAQGAELIFPDPQADLSKNNEQVSVANVILAYLPAGDPSGVVEAGRIAASNRWQEFTHEAFSKVGPAIRENIWNYQVDDVFEFYAAWLPFDEKGDYREMRARLMRLLAGRKNCRDFRPTTPYMADLVGLPKCSLDGRRETVLLPKGQWPPGLVRRFRVKEGEQLDVVGVVKRVAGGARPYPSVSRVAADPWLRKIEGSHELREVRKECDELNTAYEDVVHRLDANRYPQFQAFPYEGSVFFPSRHKDWCDEVFLRTEDLQSLKEAVAKAFARFGEPRPYLAVLCADGDRIGKAISQLTSRQAHQEFSKALRTFAASVSQMVERHHGITIYAGGDDILAFLPLDECLQCARELHDAFGSSLRKVAGEEPPTLSVGIAIGHFMEDLEDLLGYGREAEKAAKNPDRDGLAIYVVKRGGTPVMIRDRWQNHPDKRWQSLVDLFAAGELPGRLPYELRKMAEVYCDWHNCGPAIQADLKRLLSVKRPRAGKYLLKKLAGTIASINSAEELQKFANELLVARTLAAALPKGSSEHTHAEAGA